MRKKDFVHQKSLNTIMPNFRYKITIVKLQYTAKLNLLFFTEKLVPNFKYVLNAKLYIKSPYIKAFNI